MFNPGKIDCNRYKYFRFIIKAAEGCFASHRGVLQGASERLEVV
jgi:hypothetical protein